MTLYEIRSLGDKSYTAIETSDAEEAEEYSRAGFRVTAKGGL